MDRFLFSIVCWGDLEIWGKTDQQTGLELGLLLRGLQMRESTVVAASGTLFDFNNQGDSSTLDKHGAIA
jgi:hypothetical protein